MANAHTAVLNRHVAGWHVLLAGGSVVIGLYFLFLELGPSWAGPQVAAYVSANATLMIASLVTARRHRAMAGMALLLAAASAASVTGDLIFYFLALVEGEVAYPSAADVAYLSSYLFMAAAFLVAVRKRSPGWDFSSAIDAGIVAVSVGYLIFEFVVVPTLTGSTRDVATLVSVLYPLGDLMIITVGARLVLGAGTRGTALRMVGIYLGLMLYADTIYSVQSLEGTYQAGNYLDMVWMVSAFLLSAAMLHPSAPQLVARASAATPDASPGRLAILAVAAVIAPTTMSVQFLRGATPHVLVAGLVCNVLFLLVLARMAGLVRAQRHAAITDGLTGLRSRRFFEQSLHAEVARAARSGSEVGLLLLDLDHFKNVNDTYGHNGGDRVLVELAHRLTAVIRPGDLAARYGGEEFAVLLPGAGPETAAEIAERIRRAIAMAPIAVGEHRVHSVTVSIGVAGLPSICTDAEELVLAADRALYASKNAGRNRVTESVRFVGR
ncbi:GGDEF domain-containing protein [Actinoplanes solisilvae]|uniref:GGDEF domain-containing protein n=1 Tax=Actinoplanes solisilvae TaxID=2486853 RepID=UPI000FD9FE44|nr:GGDEF domain-containing protein [Actinoplanes solisilvae]